MTEKIIYKEHYHGWESLQDFDRDMHEMFDPRFNPDIKGIPEDFQGTITITVTYSDVEE